MVGENTTDVKTYTYDEVYQASLEYFKGDELAAKVFVDKYALRDLDNRYFERTPTDMHWRLAKEFARIEKRYPNPMSEAEIFELFKNFKRVVPQGSPMSSIGNPFQVQSHSNCFVLPVMSDAYSSICRTDEYLIQISKRRGGVGIDLSPLRPEGAVAHNAARTSTGISTWMERYSNTCREVGQSGRRAALMLTLSVHHPDVMTFIQIKRDKTKVTGANVSLRITDEFMNAVRDNKEYQLRFPVDSPAPIISKWVSARDVWKEIIKSAHGWAEPGVMFWDTVTRNSPADAYISKGFGSITSNPCQPAHATVLTPNGLSTMGELKIGDTIWSGQRWTKVVNKVATGIKPVYRYRTTGGIFEGTENHRIVCQGVKIEVKDAIAIDTCQGVFLASDRVEGDEYKIAVMDGLVLADGMTHKATGPKPFLCIGKDDSDYYTSEIATLIIKDRSALNQYAWEVETTLRDLPRTYERSIPEKYRFADKNTVRFFLRGLYSGNGSVVDSRITLKASSFKIVEQTQELLSSLGIRSYYTTNKEHSTLFENGTYNVKESYDLSIGDNHSRKMFRDLIGFIQKYKNDKLNAICKEEIAFRAPKQTFDIVEQTYVGDLPVYDITVDADEHTYWSAGLLVSNCSEIVMNSDACRLMLLNLRSYVQNPYTKEATFDYELFGKDVVKAQRLMDDLVDLEVEAIERIIQKIESDPEDDNLKCTEREMWKNFLKTCKEGRRTGLGITALGDTLAALGVRYGSEESILWADDIYRVLAINAYRSSCIMAGERGTFPIFEHEFEKDHPFLKRIWEAAPDVYDLYLKNGKRNIALTTTAPAGSVSTLTQTTSGIEPVFRLEYKRRKKINPTDQNSRVDFVDVVGDRWQEFTVFHHGLQEWMDVTGETNIENSPYWKSTSADCDWKASVEIQARAQKWICHAISKTCNLPKETPESLVSDIYMKAWESGIKGFTVYRDGCRDGVLVTDESLEPTLSEHHAPPRPKSLPCDIHHVKLAGQPWTILIGKMNERPYEIFGGLSKFVEIPKKLATGVLHKAGKQDGRGIYNLIVSIGEDNELVFKDIVESFDNPVYGDFTRLLSLSLRHGIPVHFMVEQLQKNKHSDMTSFSRVIARVLKTYIIEGTKSTEKKCPSCGAEGALIYQEGCLRCSSCGYSKCG